MFRSSLLKKYWTTGDKNGIDDVRIDVVAEAKFVTEVARSIFQIARKGDPLGIDREVEFWQFRKSETPEYILLVVYPGERFPTIFATSPQVYKEFIVEAGHRANVLAYTDHGC